MNNNRDFLNSFNNIEDYLKRESKSKSNSTFHYLLSTVSRNNKVVAHYRPELNTLRELRNFIVHGNIDQPLALVSDSTIERIKTIESALISPKKIREVFNESVYAVKDDQKLAEVLKIVKDKKFSQFPVIGKGGFTGLITTSKITKWFANNIKRDKISVEDVYVKDIMDNDREGEGYIFLYSYNTLYDVIKGFDKKSSFHKSTFVIIVLKRVTDKVLLDDIYTILTPWDLNKVYNNLDIQNR